MAEIKSIVCQFENTRVFNYYLLVSANEANAFVNNNNRRVVCTFHNEVAIHTSLMPRHGDFFILLNERIMKQLNLKLNDQIIINIEKDNSEYGVPMPEELEVVLSQENQGSFYFHNLTPGNQRNLIYIVNQVKNVNSRMAKALAIVAHLTDVEGKLDFKLLNIKIKEYNQWNKLNN